ncbi:sulfatase-like hydrolase/transferase [Rubritalea spongiae]|uniref:Sulfatase-like hydrolase/transferase n=1 Tax=Rubritalea spongiae TaxID=430797 RepID=A0ABW5E141_9BACT
MDMTHTLRTLRNLCLVTCLVNSLHAATKPNIIYILADDMGYGDVQCLNPERGMIPTPHMDRLAKEGMIFTDAHSSSSVCTPTRYSVLTGRYNWRTQLQSGVLWGFSKPLISENRLTVPGLLKKAGYKTAMVGKWHLGMELPTIDGKTPIDGPKDTRSPQKTNVDWSGEIKNGPVDVGFDYLYGISASLDMAPYIWIENDRFVGAVDNERPRKPAPGFVKNQVLPEIGRKTVEYIGKQDSSKPFFIYVPLTSPHTPIIPNEEWRGKSGLGIYGDFMMETDHIVGQIMAAVDASEFAENTMIIVTADNGCSPAAKIEALEKQGHFPSAQFRGNKADIYEGGHRVPFIVRWPKGVKAGSQSDDLICLTDLMATSAELSGVSMPEDAGEDSVSFAPALKGEAIKSTRKGVVHHSISGHFSYRQGNWKLLLSKGSGGWSKPREASMAGDAEAPEGQLFDLEADPGEQKNLYQQKPEVVEKLIAQLKEDIANGRSTTGPKLENDIPVGQIKLWKGNVVK